MSDEPDFFWPQKIELLELKSIVALLGETSARCEGWRMRQQGGKGKECVTGLQV